MDRALISSTTALPARFVGAFGNFAGLPASVAAIVRWHESVPDYSPLGWPTVHIRSFADSNDVVALGRVDIERAIAVVEQSLAGDGPAPCLTATARLRAVARQRPTVEADEELALAIYAEKLAKYPADAVARACEKWLETSPFWPSVSEILQACEWAMQPRRALLAKLRDALPPVTAPATR